MPTIDELFRGPQKPKPKRREKPKVERAVKTRVKRSRSYGRDRTHTFAIRLRKSENRAIDKVAELLGMTKSAFVRASSLSACVAVLSAKEAHRRELEQVVREIKEGGDDAPWSKILSAADVPSVWSEGALAHIDSVRAIHATGDRREATREPRDRDQGEVS